MRRRSDSSALTVDEEEWHAWRPSAVELLLLLVRLKDAVVARGVLCLVSAALALSALCLARPALWASLVGWCGEKILDNLIDGTVRRRPPSSSAVVVRAAAGLKMSRRSSFVARRSSSSLSQALFAVGAVVGWAGRALAETDPVRVFFRNRLNMSVFEGRKKIPAPFVSSSATNTELTCPDRSARPSLDAGHGTRAIRSALASCVCRSASPVSSDGDSESRRREILCLTRTTNPDRDPRTRHPAPPRNPRSLNLTLGDNDLGLRTLSEVRRDRIVSF